MPIESLFQTLGEPRDEPWCLAFSNTVSSRGGPEHRDRITSFEDFRAWLMKEGVLDVEAPMAGEDPRNFERAMRLREALFGIGSALSAKAEPLADDVSELNWNVQKALVAARIDTADDCLSWNLDALRISLGGAISLIALSGARAFTSDDAERVRICNNKHCGWLFLDLSKNRSRKWCDMSDCGNLAKARRYYAKQKALRAGA